MARASQIYIFFGAPVISTSLKVANENLSTAAEPWGKCHLSLTKDTFNVCTRKCQGPKGTQYLTTSDTVLASYTKNNFTPSFEKKCLLGNLLMNQVNDRMNNKTKETDESTGIVCHISDNTNTDHHMKPLRYQQFPNNGRIDDQLIKLSEETEEDTKSVIHNHLHISPLISNTQKVNKDMTSVREDDELRHFQCDHKKLCDICCPEKTKVSKKLLDPCSMLDLSTHNEFLSILTSSQVALLSRQPIVGPNEMESEFTMAKGMALGGSCKVDTLIQLNKEVGICSNAAEKNLGQDYKSSSELFTSDSCLKDSSLAYLTSENSFQKNAGVSVGVLCSPTDTVNNERHVQPWKSGILWSQGGNSPKGPTKRSQASEDAFAIAGQQQSKKTRLIYSSVFPALQMEQLKTSSLKKVQKHLSLLKDCVCKDQKYNVLVAVLHPCHIKEIQIKSRIKLSPKAPLATIVVFDQSEIQRKVVLWRAAAFWSLTVFPGDIILLTDVGVYADHWAGEIILQSTFSSQLLNLGNCLAIHPNEFSHVVDSNTLQELLACLSAKHACFQALPQREPQTLYSIQNVLLDQLKANMLVHSVVKIVNITVLTESTYSYRGEKQKKIVLTVEQVKDQHCALVLWGAAAAYCPQLQRKKDQHHCPPEEVCEEASCDS